MKKIVILTAILMISLGAFAQIEQPVKWSYAAKKTSVTEATVFLKATIQPGWHIYSLNVKKDGPIKTSFTFEKSKDYSLIGKTTAPMPIIKYDNQFAMNIGFFEKEVIFQQKIKLNSANAAAVKGKLNYMTCNDKKCLPPEDVDFTIPLSK